MRHFLFTSEAVSEGHPDKVCDQIADSILDACLAQDPLSKVACEVCATSRAVILFGEISTKAIVDYEQVARKVIIDIGYDSPEIGLDGKSVAIEIHIVEQSPDIAQCVLQNTTSQYEYMGAGDQGIVFGYACTDSSPEYMPLSHLIACKLAERIAHARKTKECTWMRPDAKTQVTIEYEESDYHINPPTGRDSRSEIKALRVHTVLISCQHSPDASPQKIQDDIKTYVINPVIPLDLIDKDTRIIINPSGRFVMGGPASDSGLTGRKIIVDTYGGWGSHGGGAFSGKDSSKVDRSGAYRARQVAKSLVTNEFCSRCIVQVSYAIGLSQPLSIYVNSYGTNRVCDDYELESIVKRNFDLRPGKIIESLELTRPIFAKTATGGHFGHEEYPWEKVVDLSHEMCRLCSKND